MVKARSNDAAMSEGSRVCRRQLSERPMHLCDVVASPPTQVLLFTLSVFEAVLL